MSDIKTVTIADIIADIESGGNFGAVRFEPAKFAKPERMESAILSSIVKIHRCTLQTAEVLYSMSFGAYQIMGFNLWGADGAPSLRDFLASPDLQLAAFEVMLGRIYFSGVSPADLAEDADSRNDFAIRYNGSIAYAKRIVDTLIKFGFKVTP